MQERLSSDGAPSLSTPFRLLLPRQIYDAIIAQAQAELPNECCGLLAGRPAVEGIASVSQQYPLVNAARSPVEYLSDAHSMFGAEKARRAAGLEFLAVYHSHPTSAPIPSKKDLDQNFSEDVVNFIISLMDGVPVVQGWWLTATAFCPASWQIKEAD
jgi:[CysO sulfur-carrier protein]-S-L-cysteine hydrolase